MHRGKGPCVTLLLLLNMTARCCASLRAFTSPTDPSASESNPHLVQNSKTIVTKAKRADHPMSGAASSSGRSKTGVQGMKSTAGFNAPTASETKRVTDLRATLRAEKPVLEEQARAWILAALAKAAKGAAFSGDGPAQKKRKTTVKDEEDREETVTILAPAANRVDTWANDGYTEVVDLPASEVKSRIERIVAAAVDNLMEEKGFKLTLPSRTSSNAVYVPELDRIVLASGRRVTRDFGRSERAVRKLAVTTRVLELVHQVLSKNIHVTKRDMFYTDVKLFQQQDQSDDVLDDVACMLGCTRNALNVVASEKGVVVGRLQFEEDGDAIDCTRQGVGGKAIPPHIDKITNIQSDALFILLVEKDAAFMRLAEDRFYQSWPCIILTAKGQPDVASRMFLKKLQETLKIPVLGLVDSDPYGLKILSVFMSGSKNLSYDSSSLTTPGIKWLGVRPSDLVKYNIPDQCLLDMTPADIATGNKLLEEDFIQQNPVWVKELKMMLSSKQKSEIQSLSSRGMQYLTHTFLPEKLRKGDWI